MSDFKKWCLGWMLLTLVIFPNLSEAADMRLLAISVNDHGTQVLARVLIVDGIPYVTPKTLEKLRIKRPGTAALRFEDDRYYPLNGYPGSAYRLDERRQAIVVSVPSEYLTSTTIRREAARGVEPTASDYGGFLNYDLLGEYVSEPGDYTVGGALELGVYAAGFVGLSDHVLREVTGRLEHVRLETTVVRDLPDERLTLRFGDSVSRGGQWGRPVRFGGLQIGTNFATQPYFVTFPTAALSGDAALPSSVDLLVNDTRRFTENVPAGPFTIEDLPVVTGAGEVTAVVRDVLGRETVISQPYYASPSLLREDVHDFSFEAGFLREQFGEESYWYDSTPFYSATYRYGYCDCFTAEAHAELDKDRKAFGIAGAAPLGTFGVVTGALAGSLEQDGDGGLFQLGFEHAGRDVSVTAFGRLTTGGYQDFGVDDDLQSPEAESQIRVGVPLGRWGTFSSSYTFRAFEDDDAHIVSSSYSLPIRDIGTLALTGLATFGATNELIGTVGFTVSLGARSSASASLQASRDRKPLKTVEARHSAPLAGGFGGAASFSYDDFARARGEVSYTSGYGGLSAAASHIDGDTGVRLNAVGGLVVADGGIFAARRIDDSFGVASVPGQADVRVYSENRLVGTTDSNGRLLIHNLRAYESNRIAIEPRDLPLEAELGRATAVVRPRFRSGVTIEFPVTVSKAVRLRVLREDGQPISPGATARLDGSAGEFPIGFDGETLIRGARPGSRVTVDDGIERCAFSLDVEIPDATMPDLGAFICRQGGR